MAGIIDTQTSQSGPEPILIDAAKVSAGIAATAVVLQVFGAPIVDSQVQAITGFALLVLIPLITWALARRKTVSVDRANQLLQKANSGTRVPPVKRGTLIG